MKKICILTLGCKVNQYESEALSRMFPAERYEVVSEYTRADAYIINTCSVTNMSDRKSRQMIRRCIKDGENPFVAVIGCYSQAKPEEAGEISGVSYVSGTSDKTKIVFKIAKYFGDEELKKISLNNDYKSDGFDFPLVTDYREKTRAIVKIQDGCNSFCSYCIIPYVRGRLRSRNVDEILNEIRELSKNGYKEIVLAGIHVCNYGIDLENITFPKLLSKIEKIDGIERIRLSSVEPLAFTDEFYEFYRNSKKICPHFHISLQSGSDTVIKRMNRHYTAEYFIKTVEKLRSIKENTSVTTDIIVGFPGETDEEFIETVKLIEKVEFLKIHTFKYSKRNGTVAAKMENQVNESIKDKRSKIIMNISDKTEKKILESYVGKSLSVLFEERKGDFLCGFSENYIPVCVPYEENLQGKICTVTAEYADNLQIIAKIPKKA